jgi:isoquinoline 1-oxidoreductase beta subunit
MVESDGGKSFDANNNLTALHMRISGQSILAFVNPQNLQNGKDPFVYTIPNLLIDHAMRNPHIPPHFWRGVNNNQNAIYLECFMKSSLIPSARTRSSFAAS